MNTSIDFFDLFSGERRHLTALGATWLLHCLGSGICGGGTDVVSDINACRAREDGVERVAYFTLRDDDLVGRSSLQAHRLAKQHWVKHALHFIVVEANLAGPRNELPQVMCLRKTS